MVEIYHNDKFMDYALRNYTTPQDERRLGTTTVHQVAVVETDDLNMAYQLTNHIDSDWTKNAGVRMTPSVQTARSTSVGDILRHDRRLYTVETFGFREIGREEECEITFHIPDMKKAL